MTFFGALKIAAMFLAALAAAMVFVAVVVSIVLSIFEDKNWPEGDDDEEI